MSILPFTPEPGRSYKLPYGGVFRCLRVVDKYQRNAVMQNVLSGWTILAHHIYKDEKGMISWDYSSQGHFLAIEKDSAEP